MGFGQSRGSIGVLLPPRIYEDPNEIPIHHKCRNCGEICSPSECSTQCVNAIFTRTGKNGIPPIVRPIVTNDWVRWNKKFGYVPIDFTSERILRSTKVYVDRDPRLDPSVRIPWNAKDRLYDRRSYHGIYLIVNGLPQNPCGRTGVTGRGHLGHFGPNHAADPIVTRWKRDENGERILHPKSRKPILQFVGIRRKDTNEYAIPGGMVDLEEEVNETLQREFIEETLGVTNLNEDDRKGLVDTVKRIFEHEGVKVYCGYVDDPRNTDNAWMETTAFNFHDAHDQHLARVELSAGDDAGAVFWLDIDSQLPLFASHGQFLEKVADLRNGHW